MRNDDSIRKSLQENLSGLYVSVQQRMELMERIEGGKKMRKRIPVSIALAAMILLMACTAYALVESDLLNRLFPDGGVREETYRYLMQTAASAEDGGVTMTVEETLFDGRMIGVTASVCNNTEETLYVAATHPVLNGIEPDSWGGNFLFNYGIDYLKLAPGETLSGYVYSEYQPGTFEAEEQFTITMEAYALQSEASVPARQWEEWALYPASAFTEENSRQAAHLELSYQADGSMIHTAEYTRAKIAEYRMDGCTLNIKEANFAPGSTCIAFDIIADDPAEAVPDRFDPSKDRRLLRWYAVFDDEGNRLDGQVLDKEYAAGSDGVIGYIYGYAPLEKVPESITIAPIENDEPVMGKAVVIEIVPVG